MRANFVMSGVAIGIRRNLSMTVALILSSAITLAFVGAAILANVEITRFNRDYQGYLNVSVFLCADSSKAPCETRIVRDASGKPEKDANGLEKTTALTTTAQTQQIEAALKSDPDVTSVTYVSQAEQYRRAQQIYSKDVASQLTVGTLPASFTVKLRNIGSDFGPFEAKFSRLPGVGNVQNRIEVISRVLDIINAARLLSVIIAGVVLIASVLLIANTIQTAAAQRKNETSIMRLVGASRWMTELPFVIETMIATAVGAVIAFGMVTFGKHFVLNNIFAEQTRSGVIPNLDVNDLLIAGGWGLIGGVVVSALIAWLTLRLYVKL